MVFYVWDPNGNYLGGINHAFYSGYGKFRVTNAIPGDYRVRTVINWRTEFETDYVLRTYGPQSIPLRIRGEEEIISRSYGFWDAIGNPGIYDNPNIGDDDDEEPFEEDGPVEEEDEPTEDEEEEEQEEEEEEEEEEIIDEDGELTCAEKFADMQANWNSYSGFQVENTDTVVGSFGEHTEHQYYFVTYTNPRDCSKAKLIAKTNFKTKDTGAILGDADSCVTQEKKNGWYLHKCKKTLLAGESVAWAFPTANTVKYVAKPSTAAKGTCPVVA